MMGSYIIACLIAGNLSIVKDWSCQKYDKEKCWEIGDSSSGFTNALYCETISPGGVSTPTPCPNSGPTKYIIPLSCDATHKSAEGK